MNNVNITLKEKTYKIACTPNEQTDLQIFVNFVEKKMEELQKSFPDVEDVKLSLMTSILITEELFSAKQDIRYQMTTLCNQREENLLKIIQVIKKSMQDLTSYND